MKNVIKKKEVDIAKHIIDYLRDFRWDIYQEVDGAGGRADIVARQGKLYWVIETKTMLSLQLLEQAHNWIGHAHLVSIGVPVRRTGGISHFAREICAQYGIGIFTVSFNSRDNSIAAVHEAQKAALNRKPVMLPTLFDEQKTMCPAGSNRGGHFTSFKNTKRLMIEEVHRRPGITLKELVDSIKHHYATPSSARFSLKGLIGTEAIPELGLTKEDGVLRVKSR